MCIRDSYWIVDPDARSIEAYRLAEGTYQLAGRLGVSEAVSLPPFPDLTLVPSSIWS